jgi:phage repressor protein C with HTH and peptisase S24 domain/transcriptional regulator with XRE-family HTH domain
MGLEENLEELEALRRILGAAAEQTAFGQFMRSARKGRGLTLDDLAAATGVAKSYLSQIETGYAPPPRDDKIRRIAAALGLDRETLVARAHLAQLPDEVKARMARLWEIFDSTEDVIRGLVRARQAGGGAGAAEPQAPADRPQGGPAAPVSLDLDALHKSGLLHHLAEWGGAQRGGSQQKVRPIPVINKVAAGYPQEFTDLGYPEGVADAYVAAPADLDDPNAFAVRVVGDSMEPKYREGDIVIVSPAAPLETGCDCFVRFSQEEKNGGEATFKRVFFDAGDRVRLQPLNERYAPVILKGTAIERMFRAVARWERL